MKKTLVIFAIIVIILMSIVPSRVFALSNNVFLNGQTGLDTNDGSSPTNAVKTFAQAKSLLSTGGTIWISGEVAITGTDNWNLSGYGSGGTTNGTIKRWDGTSVAGFTGADTNEYTGSLISVDSRS